MAIKAYNFTTLHDNTLTDAEYQVFLAAMNWLYHDVGGRRRYVFDILKYIRLPLVPTKQLDEFQAQCADLSLQVVAFYIKSMFETNSGLESNITIYYDNQTISITVY